MGDVGAMFEDFETDPIHVGEASIFVRYGGRGPPVLLLQHGHPRTSATWHRVAPRLVERGFTVVCPDLRGYGRSRGPAPTADHAGYSKRAVANDAVAVMGSLGHGRFALAGHDRGGAVALRLALDHHDAVSQVAFMDSCRSASTCPASPRGSRPSGGTGSSSPSRTYPSASSTPTRTAGIAVTCGAWARRTTTSGARPPGTPPWCGPCWRTIGPISRSTGVTKKPTGPPACGCGAPPWSCGRYETTSKTCTATR
ncbi:alpha/beta fold hydrolase [Streptosporangium sp. NPDC049644]|uniref:alpha/beta fold hydrolase n=1 Tax=Streptosporangium sp. NPDC049644 TaxID=3155507 RepID=UPI0034268842